MTLTLIFKMAGRNYGLEVNAVQEIIENPIIYAIPGGRAFLKGVLNVHGEIMPVVDLPLLLNFADTSRDQRMIVLTSEFRSLALEVCKVEHILPLDLEGPGMFPVEAVGQCARRVVEQADGTPVYLLDTVAVLERLECIFKESGGVHGAERNDRR